MPVDAAMCPRVRTGIALNIQPAMRGRFLTFQHFDDLDSWRPPLDKAVPFPADAALHPLIFAPCRDNAD